jgi:hypothetical protein
MLVPSRQPAERFTLALAVAPPEIGAISGGPAKDSTVQGLLAASGVWLTVVRGHPRRPGRSKNELPQHPDRVIPGNVRGCATVADAGRRAAAAGAWPNPASP